MPQMGVSVSEGTITKWLKSEGEAIAADESLLEISTDKVDTEVPSPASGLVSEILVQEGETVAVGTVLARIGGEPGAGTSVSTLSVEISSSGSSAWTSSPTCLSHFVMVPSETETPICGMTTSTAVPVAISTQPTPSVHGRRRRPGG